MKGIIFNLVQEVVCEQYGEDVWDQILDRSGLIGAYTSLGTYPDLEFIDLAKAASIILDVDPSAVVRTVGRLGIPKLAERYPEFFTAHRDLRGFLLTMNDVHHTEVMKLYPGATLPHFTYVSRGPDTLDIIYVSRRELCPMAEGLVIGAAQWYGEPIKLSQPECLHRGDPHCLIRINWIRPEDPK